MTKQGKAIVASGHPLVSRTAIEILEQGGNAFDAVVAAGFTGAVVEPALTSLGGGGFLMARTSQGREMLFDFFPDTPGKGRAGTDLTPHFFPVTVHFPGSDQDFNIGLGSVAVPGNLKGFIHVHQRLGALAFEKIVAPAVNIARQGVELNHHQAYFLNLLKPIMVLNKTGKKLYTPDGKYITCGDRVFYTELADYMDQLPKDKGENFYKGDIAERIVADMEQGQGLLTLEDLASFEVIERDPLEITYRGLRYLTNPGPSLGGILICAGLSLLEQETLSNTDWGSPSHMTTLVSIMMEVERLKNKSNEPGKINRKTFIRGTTHISVVDREGNVAAMTTSNGEGSGYYAPGAGIMLNNMMGEDDLHPNGFHSSRPGMRISSMMSPSMLVKDRKVKLVLGSGGSKRIRTAMTQVISNVVDFGMDIKEAVNSPRIHWDGSSIQIEPGFSQDTINKLASGWPVNVWNDLDLYFGGTHALIPDDKGAGDPRRGGNSMSG